MSFNGATVSDWSSRRVFAAGYATSLANRVIGSHGGSFFAFFDEDPQCCETIQPFNALASLACVFLPVTEY